MELLKSNFFNIFYGLTFFFVMISDLSHGFNSSYVSIAMFIIISFYFLYKDNTEKYVYNKKNKQKEIFKDNIINNYLLFQISSFCFAIILHDLIALMNFFNVKNNILYNNMPFLSFYEYLFWGKNLINYLKIGSIFSLFFMFSLIKTCIFIIIFAYIMMSVIKNDYSRYIENKRSKNFIFYSLLILFILNLTIDFYDIYYNQNFILSIHMHNFKQIITLLCIYYASVTFSEIFIIKDKNLYNYIKLSIIYFLIIVLQMILYKILIDLYFFDIIIIFILLLVRDYIIKSPANKEFNIIFTLIFLYEIIYFIFVLNNNYNIDIKTIKDTCYDVFKILISLTLLFYKDLIIKSISKYFRMSKDKSENTNDDFYSETFDIIKSKFEKNIGLKFEFQSIKVKDYTSEKKIEIQNSESFFLLKNNGDIEAEIYLKYSDDKISFENKIFESKIKEKNEIMINKTEIVKDYLDSIKIILSVNGQNIYDIKSYMPKIIISIQKEKSFISIKLPNKRNKNNNKIIHREINVINNKFKKRAEKTEI